jgi:glycosyltransferase involved in cell wall biosynthesis
MIGRSALVCTYGVPQFDKDSGSRRVMSHVEFLREADWHVDFFAVNGAGPERYVRALQRLGVAVYDPERTSFEELVLSGSYGLALFAFWQPAEQYIPTVRRLLPDCRVVVDSIDLQLLRDARRAFGEYTERRLGMDYASEVVGELNVYAAADGVLTVSQKEADIINDFVCDPQRAFTIPLCEDLARSPYSFKQRKGIVFIGSFHHPPNVSAMELLCHEILPLVDPDLLSHHPVSIVGAGLDAVATRDATATPSVRMIGWVPSVIPYLERARVSVVPLTYGAGTKGKLLQALTVGTPTVATSVGTEGLALEDGEHALVADDAVTFASSIERLLVDRVLWGRISRQGRKRIGSTHGREAVRKAFLRSIRTILTRPCRMGTLPEPTDQVYLQRLRYQAHQKLAPRIAEVVTQHVPRGATIAVLGEGSSELLHFEGCTALPFPADGDAGYAPVPVSAGDAVRLLEATRADGTDFLLIPITAHWRFMGSYPEFSEYLSQHHAIVANAEGVCELYSLRDVPATPIDRIEIAVTSEALDRTRAADELSVRLIAFYLPQFHPIPENDEWWGEGFTEWTNVARANPLFDGHYQPHVPADLGFYDLRLPETRLAQAELARRYGIAGFCYYHYWFGGKRLLERPFDEVLASGEPDFPFCLCWANEPWSRRWHGRNEDVLQRQVYSHEDDVAHIRWLLPALADSRAISIDGRPMFIVYQARDLPDPARTVDTWRGEVAKAGLPDPYLMTVETGWDEGWDATQAGFDAKVMFRPQFTILRQAPKLAIASDEGLEVRNYRTAWPILAEREDVPYPNYETVCPGWDNSPRTVSNAVVLHNSTPDAYEQWLTQVVGRAAARVEQHRIVFINAWNEWGEGCHLEPDQRFGHAYLEATRRALGRASLDSDNGKPWFRRFGELSSAVAAWNINERA